MKCSDCVGGWMDGMGGLIVCVRRILTNLNIIEDTLSISIDGTAVCQAGDRY